MNSIKEVLNKLNENSTDDTSKLFWLSVKTIDILNSYIGQIEDKGLKFQLSKIVSALTLVISKDLVGRNFNYEKTKSKIINRLLPVSNIHVDKINPIFEKMLLEKIGQKP